MGAGAIALYLGALVGAYFGGYAWGVAVKFVSSMGSQG